ncbi:MULTISPECIES: AAA family ATPase [Kamptonema]|uniref:AAA family ATPase n=1 Tax=Kamptonema TaxID=1501433 RepID=UPI0001DAC152|nr:MULTISPECIES: AAA family ATPase [Kamptonema]CBN57226.1 hypothetical protein OSCI_3360015 [Kamptonema sp. PCC 6506]
MDELVTSPEKYIAFLDEVWQAASDSDGDPQVVYPIFSANLDKFNQILVELYPNWANNILSQAEADKARNVAVNFLHFSNLIRQFPLNKNASKQEIAIIGYKLVLTVFTRHKFPEKWARTQKNLGFAYSDKITDDQTKAISCYQMALKVYTRADFAEDWANIQKNLGLAYFKKITGDQTKNINTAIDYYESALEVYTFDKFPEEWAATHKHLGEAYFKKNRWNAAIAYYNQALVVYTRDDFPESWANIQNNLGDAYFEKFTGNQDENIDDENIDAAISCYQNALEFFTHADFPESWAKSQNNLGDAYFKKSMGKRYENIDAAITCYKLALKVYTYADFPGSWAKIKNNLETAYEEKITSNCAEDIDDAIAYYQEALEFFTRSDFPKSWVYTQNNLGLAYFKKSTGNRDENIDAAITCFEKALKVDGTSYFFRQYKAKIQNNLLSAYKEKITGNRTENIDTDVKTLKCQPEYSPNQFSQETGFTEPQLTQWKNAINRKGQTIIQGPPGTGKTFIAERLAKHLIGGGDGFSDIIQFHPAYTYEDFIEGLRPITENGQLTYSIVPGRFRQFCKKAEGREDTCVLIIDEINRANLSQVFGELMYLLDERENTERFIILASGEPFRIPTNVRIIGTMNTADRSIALVDNALRRRFAFIPISPNYELLQNYHNREETDFPVNKLIGILKDVNQAINNKHYELGISFFLTKTLAEDIQDIWQMEIEPYLEEYFFDNQTKMNKFLWNKIKDELSKA